MIAPPIKPNLLRRLLCAALIGLTWCAHAAVPRPNIVMVFIDDMGWGDFSCFGNPDAKTPQVDRLAAEGIRFSQFYVNAPICSSSRCALAWDQSMPADNGPALAAELLKAADKEKQTRN